MKKFRTIAGIIALTLLVSLFGGMALADTLGHTGQRFDFDGTFGRTLDDAVLLLRYIDGWEENYITEETGDVDGDGEVNLYDAICFMRLLAGDTFDMAKALKVATYNIKVGYYYHDTLADIAQLLIDEQPDIVGLQEVDCNSTRCGTVSRDQIAYLAEKAGYQYYHFAATLNLSDTTVAATEADIKAGTNLYGHGILSKYPITFDKTIYPETQVDGAEIRAVDRYEISVGDKTIAFYNAHLNGNISNDQYKEIQNDYMVNDQYAIFVGDMNAVPSKLTDLNSDRFELLTDYDPYDTTPIDHIIVSNDTFAWYSTTLDNVEDVTAFTVESYQVDEFTYTNSKGTYTITKASDHNFRYAYLMLKDA